MATVHGSAAVGAVVVGSAGGTAAQAASKKRQPEVSNAFIIMRGKGMTPSTMLKLTERGDRYNVLNYR